MKQGGGIVTQPLAIAIGLVTLVLRADVKQGIVQWTQIMAQAPAKTKVCQR